MLKNERIIVQDLKILFICLSEKWTSIEQKALFDSCYLRDIGGTPLLLCVKGSVLDGQAESEDIKRVYITKGKITKSLGFNFVKELKRFVGEDQFDVIHLYNIKTIWPTAFLLKRNKITALFCTFNHKLSKKYLGLVDRWLLRRIDKVFTFSADMSQYFKENFAIHARKVSTIGLGVSESQVISESTKEKNSLGMIVRNTSELRTIEKGIQLFRLLKENNPKEHEGAKLHIYIAPHVYKAKSFKKTLSAFEHEFYRGDIFIQQDQKIAEANTAVLLVMADNEPLNFNEVSYLVSGIPVLFPRTLARQAILYNYGKIGDSYACGDAREARSKLYYILKYYDNYLKVLNKRQTAIIEEHGVEKYVERLSMHYERSLSLRRRHVAKLKSKVSTRGNH